MQNIKKAIHNSNKIALTLTNGKVLTVHPYLILKGRNNNNGVVLRGYIEEEPNACDIRLDQIKQTTQLSEHYAIDDACLNFSFSDYELIFPKSGDLNDPKS